MRILVIGSSGFIGQALTRHLLEAGHAVEGWSRAPNASQAGGASQARGASQAGGASQARDASQAGDASLAAHASRAGDAPRATKAARAGSASQKGYTHRAIDLSDPHSFESVKGPWDGAIHLAGHSVPGGSFTTGHIFDNLRMAAHAIDHLARVQPGLRVIYMSSAHVYRSGDGLKREDEELRPEGAYGLSKQLCEAWAIARCRELSMIVVRAFNQIGPGMRAGLLIPDLLRSLRTGSGPVSMRGADSTRDFLDVRDGVEALALLLCADLPSGSVFNLCRGEGQRVSVLAHGLMRRFGIQREVRFQPGALPPLVGDPSKLAGAIGWKPRYALDDTLDDIVGRESS